MSTLARSKLRFQIAPVAGPGRFTIVPGVLRMVLLGRIGDDQGKRATDDCREKAFTNLHVTSGKSAFHACTDYGSRYRAPRHLLFVEVVVLVVLRTLQGQLERQAFLGDLVHQHPGLYHGRTRVRSSRLTGLGCGVSLS